MKKLLLGTLLLSSVIFLPSCKKNDLKVKDLSIIHEPEFGGVYIKKTIDEFNNLGYKYGDSINVCFSNGKKLKDIPYYNGYYVPAGGTLLVGYPGYDYIKAAINYGDDLFEVLDLDESMTATITLNKSGKYLDTQTSSDIHYYDDRSKYTTDAEFANYRAMNVGDLKPNLVFRSASPCDNTHKRASYTDTLMAKDKIDFILNLADTDAKIQSYIAKDDFNSPYFLSLYQGEHLRVVFNGGTLEQGVDPIALNMNYTSKEFAEKVCAGLKVMSENDGPYLIHCQEGKDRTGFVCILIEALLNASYEEIVDDYMLTYDNYYKIDKNDSRYASIKERNVDAMLNFITNGANYKKDNLVNYAKEYLKYGGLTDSDITIIINKLHK